MKEIDAKAKNIRALLSGAKFGVDYYQRGYRWEEKHIAELLDDLSEQFLESYKPGDAPLAVKNYPHYFLGSIIISNKDGERFVIDGQQRLTSLTLLLIYLHGEIDDGQKAQIAPLIFSERYRKKSFNLDVPERTECMTALFAGKSFQESGDADESVKNVLQRYHDIAEHFPDELKNDALPFFVDWLMENVYLVEIAAYSDTDAYTIFETMNDRGLSLTPAEMLKGYLLANITDTGQRNSVSDEWNRQIARLRQLGKNEDAEAIKSWLRGQHAETIRERKKNAEPGDYDRIGTEFHRWIRDHDKRLGLTADDAFAKFIKHDFDFYGHWYRQLREYGESHSDALKAELETVYFNAQNNFTLQYPALLAALCTHDNDDVITRKLRVVAGYIDIMIARRFFNFKSISYSAMHYHIFQLVIMQIREKSTAQIADVLVKNLESDENNFATNTNFYLHGQNGPRVHGMLARMADFIEIGVGGASQYTTYMDKGISDPYEIEHIWGNKFDRHKDEFEHHTEFDAYRNRIGGLLLLPKSVNASLSDKPYEGNEPDKCKYEAYGGQNWLAKSLHENAYHNNPRFARFINDTGLPFSAHTEFKKVDLDARHELYRVLAEQIWNPQNLLRDAGISGDETA